MRQTFTRCLLIGLLLISLNVTATPSRWKLDNGMQVIVEVDKRAPVVVHQVWYKVGSISEHDGITGISHVLEHMMFKGTETHPAGEFSEIVAQHGGRENAFTSKEYTAYYQEIAADRLALMMSLEADRMRNLKLDEAEFRREVQVVKEERRTRTDDKPRSALFEQFMATAYLSSPDRLPVIGWPSDLDELTLEDLKLWYQKFYAPNNAALVVVGDVNPDEVLALARKYYGKLEPSDIATPKSRPERPQNGSRRVALEAVAKLPYLIMGFKVPTLATLEDPAEAYALEVLAGVLDGGDSARFTSNLIREQRIASSAGAGYSPFTPRETLFLLDSIPAQGVSTADMEKALLAQIQAIKEDGINEKELSRVKAQVIAEDVYEKDSMFSKARSIGSLEILGFGYTASQAYLDGIQQVTVEQVQAVAAKYFVPERMTVAVLVPQTLKAGKS